MLKFSRNQVLAGQVEMVCLYPKANAVRILTVSAFLRNNFALVKKEVEVVLQILGLVTSAQQTPSGDCRRRGKCCILNKCADTVTRNAFQLHIVLHRIIGLSTDM